MVVVWLVGLVALCVGAMRGVDVICTRWNAAEHNIWAARLAEAEAAERRAVAAFDVATGPGRFDLFDAAEQAAADLKVVQEAEPTGQ